MKFGSVTVLVLCAIALSPITAESVCKDAGCSHSCITAVDIPTCTCPEGMVLGEDSKTCTVPVTILMGMHREISAVTEGEGEVRSLVPIGTTAFDFHYNNKEIIAFADNNIMRYSFAGELTMPKQPSAIATPTSRVSSLAVDWIHQDVYWISRQRSAIEASSLSGNSVREIIAVEGEESSDWNNLVIDPAAEKLFWLGRKGVYSCGLNGKNLKSNITSWPVDAEDIALDTQNKLIYIIGNYGNGVNKVVAASHYEGTPVGDIVTIGQSGSKIYGFGVLGNTIYWESNHDGENLYKCKIASAKEKANVTLVEELYQIVYDLKIYHPDIQKTGK
uniref:EGF-like domain-containing protein n=1 Tax=Homalodisca liturata TaxID=320908 RepID=A0A1B6HF96_9HEMI